MTQEEYAAVGEFIISNLEKLMSGELVGRAVICPIRSRRGGVSRVEISMPTDVDWVTVYGEGDKDGWFKRETVHFTWVPEEQAFINDEYVYKSKRPPKETKK